MYQQYPNYQQAPQGHYPFQQQPYRPTPNVVESASATTSPDNANSGYTAYIAFAAAALVLTLVFMGIFGLLSGAMGEIARDITAQGGDHPIAYDLYNNTDTTSVVHQLVGDTLEG